MILSLDALTFGISYGINKIRLTLKSVFIITVTGFVVILGSMHIGGIMYNYIPAAKFVGGIILIVIGIFLAGDFRGRNGVKSMLNEPKSTDINCNGKIETGEAMAIAIALSLDSSAVVLGTAYLGLALPVTIMLMQLLLMISGVKLGKKISPAVNSKLIAITAGLIIIAMGFKQMAL